MVPESLATNTAFAVVFVTLIAVSAHLVITSRSARAAVLIPAVALPVAAFGHDPALIVMVATLGTGFCQTMMASAKPVAIFGTVERETYQPADLLRLAVPLMPVFAGILATSALLVWPLLLDRPSGVDARATAVPNVPPAMAVHDGIAAASPVPATGQTEAEVRAVLSDLAPLTSPRPAARPVITVRAGSGEAAKPAPKKRKPATGLEGELNKAGKELRSAARHRANASGQAPCGTSSQRASKAAHFSSER